MLLTAESVESRMGAVAWGLWPTLRFPSPLIEPDVPISGIRLVWGFLCQGTTPHRRAGRASGLSSAPRRCESSGRYKRPVTSGRARCCGHIAARGPGLYCALSPQVGATPPALRRLTYPPHL